MGLMENLWILFVIIILWILFIIIIHIILFYIPLDREVLKLTLLLG